MKKYLFCLFLFLGLIFSSFASAQKVNVSPAGEFQQVNFEQNIDDKTIEEVRREARQDRKSFISPISVVANLLTLIIIMLLMAWVYNKYGRTTLSKVMKVKDINPDIVTILSTTSLGQGKYLHVIEIAGEKLLIGSTTAQITLLKNLPIVNIGNEDEQNNSTIK